MVRLIPRFSVLALLLFPTSALADQHAGALDTTRIEQLTGAKGTLDERESVFKVSVPRDDLNVTTAGVRMTPPLGLTSWAAFKQAGQQTMVMGDMVLLEDQVSPVLSAALDSGLEVTALHNHFLWDSPKVMFMHIGGMGEQSRLAAAVGKVFATIRQTSGGGVAGARARIDPADTSLDPGRIEAILGHKGALSDGVYKLTIGRTTRMMDHEIGNAMGVNTWAAFAGSDDEAVVAGDFAMHENELQPVLKALRRTGIHIVAIHNHMVGEQPRIIFLHYWGIGPTTELARGLNSALDAQHALAQAPAGPVRIDFEDQTADKPPAGFATALTGRGEAGVWVIRDDPSAPAGAKVLAQESPDRTSYRFPVCIFEDLTARDVAVSVAFKPVDGEVDQAAGIVLRYQDRDNYYIVRANAIEDNVRLYRIVDGQRRQFGGVDVEVPPGKWHTLSITAVGSHFEVSMNDVHLFAADDETFKEAGKIGLWTKADSITRFDNLVISVRDRKE